MSTITTFGAFKLIEEMGELLQVLGKLGPFPDGEHPDGGPSLGLRIEEEAADVLAAITYFITTNTFNEDRIAERAASKIELFYKWQLTSYERSLPHPNKEV